MRYRELKRELGNLKKNQEHVAELERKAAEYEENVRRSKELAASVGITSPALTSTGRLTSLERRRVERLRLIPANRVCSVCKKLTINTGEWAVKNGVVTCLRCAKKRPRKPRVLDEEKIETILYYDGQTDREVAELVGVSVTTVRYVRKRYEQ